MRWLFLVLLLLNLLYGLWNWQHIRSWLPEQGQVEATVLPAVESAAPTAPVLPEDRSAATMSPGGVTLCMMLGPLEELGNAQQVRQRLLALNVSAAVRSLQAAGNDRHWLLLDAPAGESPAISMGRLRAAGFDGFQVDAGPFSGRIAVGAHDDLAYAQARRAQIESHGFVINLQAASTARNQYWVEVDAASRRLVDQRMLGALRRDFSGLQHQFRPCTRALNDRD